MNKIILLDENSNMINSIEFEVNEFFKDSEIVEEIGKLTYQEFIDVIEYGVDIYTPYNEGNDFVVKNISDLLLSLFKGSAELVKGRLISKSFPVLKRFHFIDILKDVYINGKTKKFKARYYDGDNLIGSFNHAVINFNGEIVLFTKTEKSVDIITQQEEDLFSKSIQGIVIIQNQKIVRVNQSFANAVGYSINELLEMDTMGFEIFDVDEDLMKEVPKKVESIFFKLINGELLFYDGFIKQKTKNGDLIWLKTHAVPIIYNKRPAVQVSSVDVTKSRENQINASRFKNALDLVQGVSKIAFVYWDPIDKFQWTDEIYKIIEEDKSKFTPDVDILKEVTIKDDRAHVKEIIKKASEENTSFETIARIKTKKGIKHVNIYGKYSLDKEGNRSSVGYIQDVSESVSRELTLEKALVEKDFLIKEVNHRVKNNLQIILSLLNLDLRRNSHNLEKAIQSTQNRIKAMAFIHEKTYESADLDHVDIKEYIEMEASSLLEFYGATNIEVHEDLESIELSMDVVTPLGLAINEIIINVIKYAFPDGKDGNLNISIGSDGEIATLIIGDDGIGMDEDIDIYNSPSLGLSIINSLVSQIEGSFKKLDTAEGTVFEIQFKINS